MYCIGPRMFKEQFQLVQQFSLNVFAIRQSRQIAIKLTIVTDKSIAVTNPNCVNVATCWKQQMLHSTYIFF